MISKVVAALLAIVVVIAAIVPIVLVIIVVVFMPVILGILLGIPYYLLRKGPRSEEGRYDLAEVKSIKEDEKK